MNIDNYPLNPQREFFDMMKCIEGKLIGAGLKCSFEYPGYLSIPIDKDYSWNIGNSNDQWGGELMHQNGNQLAAISFVTLPSDFTDVDTIVGVFLSTFSKQLEQQEVIQSFQNQIRILKNQCAYRDGQISELRKATKLDLPKAPKYCSKCGQAEPEGMSCLCHDNHCE